MTQETEGTKPGADEAGYWHALHLFYRVDRGALAALAPGDRASGNATLVEALTHRPGSGRPSQQQAFLMVGHKADFGAILAGPDPKALRSVQSEIQAGPLGPALTPTYSFYSITEVSEYVPDADAYAAILRDREGMDPESSIFKTRVAQYAARLGDMNHHRLFPEFPDWPHICFYPMNKMRVEPDQNWYRTPFAERMSMMTEHGKSGMKYGGRVSQVITASTGLDDWEWGVTLWSRTVADLKDIVYTMRFDRASAQYAEFGPFYPGLIMPPAEIVEALHI